MARCIPFKHPLAALVTLAVLRLSAQQVVTGEWFIDEDPGHGQANTISFTPSDFISFAEDLSVSIDPGFHWFSLRVRDNAGHWSHTHTRPMYVRQSLADANMVALEWFTDEDPGHGQGEAIPITAAPFIEVSEAASFPPGEWFRWVSIRAQDELGSWSHTHTRPVFVRPETGGVIVSAEWFIGEDPGFGAANPIAVGDPAPVIEDILFEAITQGLDVGDHVVMVRVFNDRGTPSLAYPVAFTIDTGTGMDLQEQLGLTIGPNPTRDLLTLRADQPVEGMHLRLMDSAGRILHQDFFNGNMDLDLSGHATGTYHLFLSDAKGKYTVFPVVKM